MNDKRLSNGIRESATLDVPDNWEVIIEGWCSPEFSQGCIIDDTPKPNFR